MTRRFELIRHTDITGASGTGRVAVGVLFEDGVAVTHWLTEHSSTVVWHGGHENSAITAIQKIHTHGGHSEIRWLDPEVADG
jgi:hypothetical protein